MSDVMERMKIETGIKILAILVFIGMLGALKPVIFNGGSSTAKYFAKQNQLEMVSEEKVEDYFEAVLFGEGEAKIENIDALPEEQRTMEVETIFAIDRWVAIFLLCTTGLLLTPLLFKAHFHHVLLMNLLWLLTLSLCVSLNGGKKFSDLALAAHATRWGLPLVLWWVLHNYHRGKKFTQEFTSPVYILLICSSLTFAVHGWEAFSLNPPFQDLIYNFGGLIGLDIPTSVNTAILKTVGCMDLILAAIIFFVKSPKIFIWMAFWGLITAFSRPLTLGFDAWPEFTMRIANCGLPLMLFLLHRKTAETPVESQELNTNMEMTYE